MGWAPGLRKPYYGLSGGDYGRKGRSRAHIYRGFGGERTRRAQAKRQCDAPRRFNFQLMDPPAPKPTRPACNSLLADLQLQAKRVEWTLDSGVVVVGVGCVSPLRSDDSANATVNATALHMAARLSGSIGVKSPVAHGGRRPQREVVRQSARGNRMLVSCSTECTRRWKIWQRDRDIFVRCGHANDACAWWWSSFHT